MQHFARALSVFLARHLGERTCQRVQRVGVAEVVTPEDFFRPSDVPTALGHHFIAALVKGLTFMDFAPVQYMVTSSFELEDDQI